MTEQQPDRPKAPLEQRTVTELDVRYPERIIELIAVPYDEEAVVEHHGRMVVETIAPGSFDGVERRANRIKVNLEHDRNRGIGRAVALHPSRKEGLVAELLIGRSTAGDETLAYAEDGILDASVSFAPWPGHEEWTENRSRRRITKAFLDHIAMVLQPAYDGANVLAVRHDTDPDGRVFVPALAPNLIAVRAQRLAAQYGLD